MGAAPAGQRPITETIGPRRLSKGFIEAARVWGQFVTENRDSGWGVLGAMHTFRLLDLPLPAQPPSQEFIEALIAEKSLRVESGNDSPTSSGDFTDALNRAMSEQTRHTVQNNISIDGIVQELAVLSPAQRQAFATDLNEHFAADMRGFNIQQNTDYWDAAGNLGQELLQDIGPEFRVLLTAPRSEADFRGTFGDPVFPPPIPPDPGDPWSTRNAPPIPEPDPDVLRAARGLEIGDAPDQPTHAGGGLDIGDAERAGSSPAENREEDEQLRRRPRQPARRGGGVFE